MPFSKTYLLLFFIITSVSVCTSQSKNVLVIDELTNEPIEEVYLFYPLSEEGSFTNLDGIVTILVKKEHLKVIHTNYEEVTIDSGKITTLDTIKLRAKNFKSNNRIINSFNLKKELQYVLDNYDDLYLDYATEKECSFKGTLIINEEIHRLIVSELKIWTRDAAIRRGALDTIKLKLGAIKHYNSVPKELDVSEKITSNSEENRYLITRDLLANSYLDIIIDNFLKYSGKIEETIEESASDIIVVSFKTSWRKHTKEIIDRVLGRVVFDKNTRAIIEFSREIELKSDYKEKMSGKSSKKDRYEIENQFIKFHFNKNSGGKYSLKTFTIGSDLMLNFEKMIYNVKIKNELFVLKETKLKKANMKGLISLGNVIYQTTPSKETNANSIVLTKKEKEFLSTNKLE